MAQKYLGITPYDEDSCFEFAGRNEETWALYDRIIRNEYTVYYAASGEGKSSLIRAGLLPILRRRNYFPIYIVFEDKELEDLSSIETVIDNRIKVEEEKHKVTYGQSIWSMSRFDQEVSGQLKNDIWWRLRNYCFKRGDTELRPLFIFDQFEEVFTKANYDWTNQFFGWLEKISTDYLPESLREFVNSHGIDMPTQKNYKALFSFRMEYLGDLDYWCVQKHFIPSLQENRMCLKPLTPKGAKEIINLNESSLGKYALKITQGCAETKANINTEEQPCVYALILSVVCQTLSDITDDERVSLLEKLNSQQDETIDDILLKFYKKKLHAAGLDYVKDEKIIAEIENELVDEKGKRSRRDTDEASMLPLAKWINLLSDKSNGLIKIIGKKEVDGTIVNTVEFPHDRLCRAIDSSRKERQGKISWRLKRQTEWMQLGIISAVVGIIAFLWNALMPSIKPVISNALSKTGFIHIKNLFFQNYIGKNWHLSEYAGYSLDEGFSTLFLMVALVLFVPLMTISIVRKGKKWQLTSSAVSTISLLSFAFLWYKNINISFANSYVPIFTFIGATFSIACLCISTLRLRMSYTKGELKDLNNSNYSNWPLWGGYIIFASYLFYELLFRTTFGINEPSDSSLALIVLPLLYSFFAWGFFNMTFSENDKKQLLFIYVASIISLLLLGIISFVPYYNNFKQSYGFAISIILILLWLSISTYIIWKAKSNSQYYILSKPKRLLAITIGAILIISTFILNLGYNPIAINPKTVCYVATWRDVIVFQEDSIAGKKFGVLYSIDGDTIIPYCIPKTIDNFETRLAKGVCPFQGWRVPIESKFTSSPFANDSICKNDDGSLFWFSYNNTIRAYIHVVPTLEQYLHTIRRKGIKNHNTLKEVIDFYAVNLFYEIRKANIRYATEGKLYTIDLLKSFSILDSLQHISLGIELNKLYSSDGKDSLLFDDMEIVNRSGRLDTVPRYMVLQDKHLIDFHRELSRSFLLCLIKDRVLQSDMPSMFTLANTYLIAFFTSVPAMNIHSRFNINFALNTKEKGITSNKIALKKVKYDIYSDDILKRRFFAWYDLFSCLCMTDMSWNSKTYKNTFYQLYRDMSAFDDIQKEMLTILENANVSLDDIMKNGKNAADSLFLLTNYSKNFLKTRDSLFYKSYLVRLEKITPSLNYFAVDQSLKQLKDDVFSTLLSIMKKRPDGIYNNDFENICRNLILVSAFRGNDIEDNSKELSEYLAEKNNEYDIVNRIDSVRGYTKQFLENKNETEELLRRIIKNLRKTN